jgi:hypothetical protein
MQVINVKYIDSGSLIATFDVKLENGLILTPFCLFFSPSKQEYWVKVPGEDFQDKEGNKKRKNHIKGDTKDVYFAFTKELLYYFENEEKKRQEPEVVATSFKNFASTKLPF